MTEIFRQFVPLALPFIEIRHGGIPSTAITRHHFPMANEGWRWADAWIFVSLVIASKAGRQRRSPGTRRPEGARLADVLATADHLRRAIPDRHDLEIAVRRLAGAGLVSVTDGWFRLTPAGEQLWRARAYNFLGTAVDAVHRVLNRRQPPNTVADWTLDEHEHALAVQELIARRRTPAPRHSPENDRYDRQPR
jgi:hypothetical protein